MFSETVCTIFDVLAVRSLVSSISLDGQKEHDVQFSDGVNTYKKEESRNDIEPDICPTILFRVRSVMLRSSCGAVKLLLGRENPSI